MKIPPEDKTIPHGGANNVHHFPTIIEKKTKPPRRGGQAIDFTDRLKCDAADEVALAPVDGYQRHHSPQLQLLPDLPREQKSYEILHHLPGDKTGEYLRMGWLPWETIVKFARAHCADFSDWIVRDAAGNQLGLDEIVQATTGHQHGKEPVK